MKLSVFILAAGIGERLRPITNYIPKPLLPILGKPVLESVLEKVSCLPINRIGMNLHHKREVINNWIRQSSFSKKIELFPEDHLLGTGGALKNAREFLKNRSFLVHNADIISDIDLKKLVDFHLSSKNLATLAVHDCPEFNRLILDKEGFLNGVLSHPRPFASANPTECGKGKNNPPLSPLNLRGDEGGLPRGGHKILAFTGIAVYQPEFLQFLPDGNSSVVDAWLRAISAGYKIGTLDATGCYWTDIGTPAPYARAVFTELGKIGETIHIDPSATSCQEAEINGHVVIERECRLHDVFLRNCLVLPGTEIGQGTGDDSSPQCFLTLFRGVPNGSEEHREGKIFENCIIGPGFKMQLRESDIYENENGDTFLIGTGGSDRRYYRVKRHRHSEVLMKCAEDDPDFERHIDYTRFFRRYAAPVPELIDSDPLRKTAFFEDLGDLSLYSWLKCPREQKRIENMYKKVLDILVLLHTRATDHVNDCPFLRNRIFDYEYLRWETSYFLERFVKGVKQIDVNNLSALEDEFHKLALKVDSFPKSIVHRDFQSQNIMITRGDIPRILDYQGARIGPPAYDVVSILWDPYYRLEDDLREKLVEYYIHKVIPPHPPLKEGGDVSSSAGGNTSREVMSPFTKGGLRGITHTQGENTDPLKYPSFGKWEHGGVTEDELRAALLPCRLQRHMQALGAYGFLSIVKGKKYFMNYIPEGLRLLDEDLSAAQNEYPALHRLIKKL